MLRQFLAVGTLLVAFAAAGLTTAHAAPQAATSERAPNGTVVQVRGSRFTAPRSGHGAVFYFSAKIVSGPGPIIFRFTGHGGWKTPRLWSTKSGCGGDYPQPKLVHGPKWVFEGSDCGFTTAIELTPTGSGPHAFTIRPYVTSMMYRWPPKYAFKRAVLNWEGTVKSA
jgi:hypothetical protein